MLALLFLAAIATPAKKAPALNLSSLPVQQSFAIAQPTDVHDPKSVVEWFGAEPKKGEYEKTEEFEERLKKRRERIANLGKGMHRLAFRLKPAAPRLGPFTLEYDADRERLTVQLDSTMIPEEFDMDRGVGLFCPWSDPPTILGQYEASNAFGVKVTVTKTIASAYCVAAPMPGTWRFEGVLSMSANQARDLKEHLVGVITIAPFEVLHRTEFLKPTIDSPIEGVARRDIFVTPVLGLLLYDERTRGVVARWDISEQMVLPAPPIQEPVVAK